MTVILYSNSPVWEVLNRGNGFFAVLSYNSRPPQMALPL